MCGHSLGRGIGIGIRRGGKVRREKERREVVLVRDE
jgi:hypothetical protein